MKTIHSFKLPFTLLTIYNTCTIIYLTNKNMSLSKSKLIILISISTILSCLGYILACKIISKLRDRLF